MTIEAGTKFYAHKTHGHLTYRTPSDGDRYPVPIDYRPVVVIDPEDGEQVERLWDLYRYTADEDPLDGMRHALREFANPTPPRPDEPLGLGAVVEDATGSKWVRVDSDEAGWFQSDAPGSSRCWLDFGAAVKVLSEGVPI